MQKAALIAAFMLQLPVAAFAADIPPPTTDWHRCTRNEDCVLVPGICGKASVNYAFVAESTKYYAQEARRANCAAQFWRAEPSGARCRLESCELAFETKK